MAEENMIFNPADANQATRRFLDNIMIEQRLIGADIADLTMQLFGETFSSPIMMPAFSHLNKVNEEGRTPMQEYAAAAKELNIVNWVGMEPDEIYKTIAEEGAKTIRIIKPFADKEVIREQMKFAEELGALAVGVDIDHAFGPDGEYDVVDGITMHPLTEEDIKAFKAEATVPFIIKGVLSASDALACQRAGVDAIVVSHHHGRMPFAIPPLQVLPEIIEALGENNTMKIFVDCSIDDGRDAYKALAMGADAVSVGRGMMPGLMKDGRAGVVEKVTRMNQELAELMEYTGVHTLADMDPSVLWER